MIIFIFILSGLLILYLGAELLVRYSAHLAAILGVSPLIIGLTIVAYGTSTPELIVNMIASLSGSTEIAIGNVVGSNIFNVLFILGLSAIICPLIVHQQIIKFDVPVMIGASFMVWLAAWRWEHISLGIGILFLFLILLYTFFLIRQARKEKTKSEFKQEYQIQEPYSWRIIFKDVCFILSSLGILVLGSQLLVSGAVSLAKNLGVSELVISLTIVAAGTSLPELATSALAAIRGERDIAVGNIVGSNIYNIWAILGLSAVLAPDGLPVPENARLFDIPVMVAASVACLPIFFTGRIISRWEGVLFLGYYMIYLLYLLLTATGNVWLGDLQNMTYFFLFPLTLLTLIIGMKRKVRG